MPDSALPSHSPSSFTSLPGVTLKSKGEALSQARRHWTTAIWMQLVIRAKYLWLQWFGLKPFILGWSSRPSVFRPANAPRYDFITRFTFMTLLTVVALTRQIPLIYFILCKLGFFSVTNRIHTWMTNRLIRQMKAQNWHGKTIPVPEFDWRNKSPEEFCQLFVRPNPGPVVLRGFMKDNKEMFDQLSWDAVLRNYSEEDVILTKPELDGMPGKLKEVNDPRTYLHNSEILFQKYPQIRDLFKYHTLEPYTGMKVGYEQMFVGRGGTGTQFHRASNFNFFYMINGQKRWWLVDPYDTVLMYQMAFFGRAAHASLIGWPDDDHNNKFYPLFKYAPCFHVDLEPGDVLWNPTWWWHAIKNISETSVAVASRWHTDGICGHNMMMTEEDYEIDRAASMGFFMGIESWKFLHGILQTPSPRYDEHATLREVNNRFTNKQLGHSRSGGVNLAGVISKI